jgi:hypothetical protein
MDSAYVALGGLLFTVVCQLATGAWVASNVYTRLKQVENQVSEYRDIGLRLTRLEVVMDGMSTIVKDIRDTLKETNDANNPRRVSN